MSHTEFTTTTNEFIGTAAGHTIGMVIPNIDPEVRTLLKIPEQYSSLGILTSRTGAAAQAFSVDEAAKACNVELLIFELPRDTEGYSGHGNLIVLGAYDVSDARRAVEVALTLMKSVIWKCTSQRMPVPSFTRFLTHHLARHLASSVPVLPELPLLLQIPL